MKRPQPMKYKKPLTPRQRRLIGLCLVGLATLGFAVHWAFFQPRRPPPPPINATP